AMKRGFTLMEILVVLAILGLGMSIVTALTTATTRQTERIEEETAVQTECQNILNSILAGDATVAVGMEIPIPDAPNWSAVVDLLDGPIDNIVAVRVTAQRYLTIETPDPNNPLVAITAREADFGRRFVVKEWARRADVRTRSLTRNLDGTISVVEGTADELLAAAQANAAESGATPQGVESELGGGLNNFGAGAVQPVYTDPFADVEAAMGFGVGL
ncbi:MAG: type II secretion system protein, partial [Thermoguttaceae bacterium]|nr:type II secretion system protein [Thermoguttaceae bacterium]